MLCFRFLCSYALFIIGSTILPIAPLCAQETAPAIEANLRPREGEIQLSGRLETLDWKTRRLELLVGGFTLPDGSVGAIDTSKSRLIFLPAEVSPFVSDELRHGDLTSVLRLGIWKRGLSIIVVGRDSGTGQPLTARAVFVRDTEENRRFLLSARPKTTADKGAQPWETARIGLAFNDAAGNRAGEWPPSLKLSEDSDWKTLSLTLPVPIGAVFFKITPQFINANGVLDVDDIQIEQLK